MATPLLIEQEALRENSF